MKINTEKHKITQKELMHWVDYHPITGKMYRIRGIHPSSGKEYERWSEVTGTNNRGYKWLKLLGRMYLVHRLIVLYMTGKHPENEVDHINGDRGDNRWVNLRQCDPFSNSRNQGIRKDCTSGVRGVNYNTAKTLRGNKRWIARISHKGERIHIGNFETFEEAVNARKNAEIDLGYHPNHAKRESWSK